MTTTATPPACDYVERYLLSEYNHHAHSVDHYFSMEYMANTERGKSKWRHLCRLAQKMKDDILGILFAYQQGGRSLSALAGGVYEAQDERRDLLAWLAGRPEEAPEHTRRVKEEMHYFAELMNDILHHVKYNNPGTKKAAEAAAVLASLQAAKRAMMR